MSNESSRSNNTKVRSREEDLSRYFSYILRHGAHKKGVAIRPDGYALVKDILLLKDCKPSRSGPRFTIDEVVRVVKTNGKQRFHLYTDKVDNQMWIRANQGHSLEGISVDMRQITSDDCSEFATVVHGTYYSAWKKIREQGLSRCNRHHIHFSKGQGAISGMRGDCQVLIYIDLKKALKDGFDFFESSNGVILTAGNKKGFLPPEYFSSVVDAKSGADLCFESVEQ